MQEKTLEELKEELQRIAGNGRGGFIITDQEEMVIACLAVFISSREEKARKEGRKENQGILTEMASHVITQYKEELLWKLPQSKDMTYENSKCEHVCSECPCIGWNDYREEVMKLIN
jgi:hypothetical protein